MSNTSQDPMQSLFEKLTANMQLIYRKSIDADQSLAKLQQTGKGKFNHIFTDDAGFQTQSKRFMPYVEELANNITQLDGADQQQLQSALPEIVRKMELMLATLSQFKQSL